jgi:hypothetical protein
MGRSNVPLVLVAHPCASPNRSSGTPHLQRIRVSHPRTNDPAFHIPKPQRSSRLHSQ